ncbi:MAG TPA: hypothetical protein VD962_03015 [Rubricoccaceae bacterium]|nr:hypothetical protein [Rubricoccaceae bacterium]
MRTALPFLLLSGALLAPARAQPGAQIDTTWVLDGRDVHVEQAFYRAGVTLDLATDTTRGLAVRAGVEVVAHHLTLDVRGARGRVTFRADPSRFRALGLRPSD